MKLESNAGILLAEAADAFELAKDDVLAEARRRADKHRRTGKFSGSLTATDTTVADGALVARVGSPLSSARVKELGGFMQARVSAIAGGFAGHMAFRLREGAWVKLEAFRVAATPIVKPAGKLFPDFYRARLAQLRGSDPGKVGSARMVRPGKTSTTSGAVRLPR